MLEDFNSWNNDEFLAFVLIKASFADKLIQEDEKKVITHMLPIDRFYQLLEFYRNNNDAENMSIMLKLKGKFLITKSEKDKLFEKVRALFISDGQFSWVERNLEKAIIDIFG